MPSNLVVCVKQVPKPEELTKVKLDPGTKTLKRESTAVVLNPVDRNAVEAAIELKPALGGEITALTMGPPKAMEAIQDAYAMGADNGIHLCDRAYAAADTLATARALAPAIQTVDDLGLILFGNESIDSGTGQVPVQVAELLELPCATHVTQLSLEENTVRVWQAVEGGHLEIELPQPCVISVTKDLNNPRKPSIMGIMQATRKEITTYACSDLGTDTCTVGKEGSPTWSKDIGTYDISRKGQKLEGAPEDIVREALEILHKGGVI